MIDIIVIIYGVISILLFVVGIFKVWYNKLTKDNFRIRSELDEEFLDKKDFH